MALVFEKVMDSGKRQEFETGAVRDIQSGKGRYDLLPTRAMRRIAKHFENEKIFAVSLGEISGGPGWANFKNGNLELIKKDHQETSSISFWGSGGQAAFSKKIWLEIGGFDSLYKPFYFEDLDLSYRAWKRGYEIIWEPKSRIIHDHVGTIKTNFSKSYISSISQRNHLIFMFKNITDSKMTKEILIWLIKQTIKPSYWKTIIRFIVKLPKVLAKRIEETKAAKISDYDIFQKFN